MRQPSPGLALLRAQATGDSGWVRWRCVNVRHPVDHPLAVIDPSSPEAIGRHAFGCSAHAQTTLWTLRENRPPGDARPRAAGRHLQQRQSQHQGPPTRRTHPGPRLDAGPARARVLTQSRAGPQRLGSGCRRCPPAALRDASRIWNVPDGVRDDRGHLADRAGRVTVGKAASFRARHRQTESWPGAD